MEGFFIYTYYNVYMCNQEIIKMIHICIYDKETEYRKTIDYHNDSSFYVKVCIWLYMHDCIHISIRIATKILVQVLFEL